jgi:hypothetical protein
MINLLSNLINCLIHLFRLVFLPQVPRWVVKPLVGRPSTLGTPTKESLDDAVFNKRHLKHEMDEKRRKRYVTCCIL